jgi:DNA-binding CsgD family transcriptional regulator
MGDAAFHAAARRGARLALGEAVAYALKEVRPGRRHDECDGDGGSGAAGGAAGGGARGGDRHPPLTAREREIARHVARGKSNKEIAAALIIAPRTVEGHVERILRKLGFSSRAQIATWLSQRARAADADQ